MIDFSDAPAWYPHPDNAFERTLGHASEVDLGRMLRDPRVAGDPYAYLRTIDALHKRHPEDKAISTKWIQAMLLSNRAVRVWNVIDSRKDEHISDDDLFIRAQVAQSVNLRTEAREAYASLLTRVPDAVDVWQKYVDFERPATEKTRRAVEALYDKAPTTYAREKYAFTLARLLEREEPLRAFSAAEEAHALKRRRIGAWSREESERRIALDACFSSRTTTFEPAPITSIFVVGVPRSGTTLVSSILGSHSEIGSVGEQNLIPYLFSTIAPRTTSIDAAMRAFTGRWYRAATADLLNGKTVSLDKLPANIEHCAFLLDAIPGSIVLHVDRDARDSAISNHFQDFEYGCLFSDDPKDLGVYARTVAEHASLIRGRNPDRFFKISYEELAESPEKTLKFFLERIGLQWESAMDCYWTQSSTITTFSESQVRNPLNRHSVGRWRHYLPEAQYFFKQLESPDYIAQNR